MNEAHDPNRMAHSATPPPVKKERDSNLELFRIIVMLLIVAHHYLVNSGLKEFIDSQPLTAQSCYLYTLGMWGKTGINCFVLITGYFMCKSRITLHKFLKLVLQVYFYAITIGLIFVFTGYTKLDADNIAYFLFPFNRLNTGFKSAFVVYFLFIPFLNIVVNSISKRQHQALTALCLAVYCVFAKVGFITLNYVAWFMVLHIIASYLRFYVPEADSKARKRWGLLMATCIVLSVASVLLVRRAGLISLKFWFVSDSNAPLAICTGITSFMFFKNLKVKQSKLINTIASTTFGILLIHAHSAAMRQWLWSDTLHNTSHFGTPMGWVHPIVSVLAVFAVCSLIDYLRARFLEKPLLPIIVNLAERGLETCKWLNH